MCIAAMDCLIDPAVLDAGVRALRESKQFPGATDDMLRQAACDAFVAMTFAESGRKLRVRDAA